MNLNTIALEMTDADRALYVKPTGPLAQPRGHGHHGSGVAPMYTFRATCDGTDRLTNHLYEENGPPM